MNVRFTLDKNGTPLTHRTAERGTRWIRTGRERAILGLLAGTAKERPRWDEVAEAYLPTCAELAQRLRSSVARVRADGDRVEFAIRQAEHWGTIRKFGVEDVVRALLNVMTLDTKAWLDFHDDGRRDCSADDNEGPL